MTVQFSRSVRSIQADNLVPVLVGIGFFTVLMLGWMLWLFLAQIPFYATSTRATYHQEGYVIATFPPVSLARIRRGQPARLLLAGGSASKPIPLIASDVDPVKGEVRLVLHLDDYETPHLQAGETGQVKVTVRQLSPILFILRAAGLWPDE